VLETDPRVADALERLVPSYDRERGDWGAVVSAGRRGRRWRAAAAFGPVVVALVGLVLAWPFGGESGDGVLERALAAAGDGPVTHAVFRESNGETQEVWHHPELGLLVIDGASLRRSHYSWGRLADSDDPDAFAAFLRVTGIVANYRESLESGRARLLRDGVVDGTPVHWIFAGAVWNWHDVEVWALEVAVSRRTYEPVAVRTTRDGKPRPAGITRIVRYETLPEEAFPEAARP
jgi:hypothetical protein